MKKLRRWVKNGYLASPYDSADLSNGIQFVIENNDGCMSDQARKIAEELFDIKDITQKYINLYQRLLEEQKR